MIDWPALARLFTQGSAPLVSDNDQEVARAACAWRQLTAGALTYQNTAYVRWRERIEAPIVIEPYKQPHTVIGVDGSQIYPDRHEGLRCALTNTAAVIFNYGHGSTYRVLSVPQLIAPHELAGSEESSTMVDAFRHERELAHGLAVALDQKDVSPMVLLFDGSLVFWHMLTMGGPALEAHLNACMRVLVHLHQARVPVAWYTSLPGSNQLIRFLQKTCGQTFENIVDADVMGVVLVPGQRCQFFEPVHPLIERYPEPMRPVAMYLNAGAEIGRIELPAWIADDAPLLSRVLAVIVDQCHKGGGYPISLAHAHEQAVVTSVDRARFFRFVERMLRLRGLQRAVSRKQANKRRLQI